MSAGDLYRHTKGGLYREVHRCAASDNYRAGAIMQMQVGFVKRPFMATDSIQRGEQVVAYEEVPSGLPWLRPAHLFDDGRFAKQEARPAFDPECPACSRLLDTFGVCWSCGPVGMETARVLPGIELGMLRDHARLILQGAGVGLSAADLRVLGNAALVAAERLDGNLYFEERIQVNGRDGPLWVQGIPLGRIWPELLGLAVTQDIDDTGQAGLTHLPSGFRVGYAKGIPLRVAAEQAYATCQGVDWTASADAMRDTPELREAGKAAARAWMDAE